MAAASQSIKTLKYVAIYGGVLALGGAGYFTWRIQDNFRSQEYYKKSVELLHGYPRGTKLFGEPLIIKRLDLGDTAKNHTDGLTARITLPLKGPRKKGNLHSWSHRESLQESWIVDKLDLEVDEKQWTFFINPLSRQFVTPTGQENSTASPEASLQSPSTNSQDMQNNALEAGNIEKKDERLLYINIK